MTVCQQSMAGACHQSIHSSPIPSACAGTKIERNASVELSTGMKTQHTPMRILRCSFGTSSVNVVREHSIGCNIADRTVNNKSGRASRRQHQSQLPNCGLEYSFELRNDTRYIRKGDQAILSQRCHVEP